jgi:hypothetical protein
MGRSRIGGDTTCRLLRGGLIAAELHHCECSADTSALFQIALPDTTAVLVPLDAQSFMVRKESTVWFPVKSPRQVSFCCRTKCLGFGTLLSVEEPNHASPLLCRKFKTTVPSAWHSAAASTASDLELCLWKLALSNAHNRVRV